MLRQNYYREQADLLIVGVGAGYQDAVETVGRIVDETYRETGGFDVKTYLREKEDRLRKRGKYFAAFDEVFLD